MTGLIAWQAHDVQHEQFGRERHLGLAEPLLRLVHTRLQRPRRRLRRTLQQPLNPAAWCDAG